MENFFILQIIINLILINVCYSYIFLREKINLSF